MASSGMAWNPQALPPSGLLKAGTILLLIGAILQTLLAALLVGVAIVMLLIGQAVFGEEGGAIPFVVIGVFYLLFGLMLAVGAVFGFYGYGRAKAGDARAAWVRGLVSALLPPVHVVSLVGAILCLVSPEGEAQGRQP